MRIYHMAVFGWLIALCASAGANSFVVNTLAVTTALDGHDAVNGCTPASCTLRDAIAAAAPAGGTTITFAIPLPATIQLQSGGGLGAIEVNNPLTVSGPGTALLSIAAPGNNRVMNVNGSQVFISGLTIRSGAVTGTTPYGASGGCIYVTPAGGLILNNVDVRDCSAHAADGSPGAFGGYGTPGGAGGDALGGAIYVAGALSLLNSSVINNSASAGSGGTGADGDPSFFTPGGNGGTGGSAAGGGIYVNSSAALHIENSTIAANVAQAGWGGDAGTDAFGTGAAGGTGGDAEGGLIYVASGTVSTDAVFATLSGGSVEPGQGGFGGPGNDGANGSAHGSAVYALSAITVASDVIVSAQPGVVLCEGALAAMVGSVNLDEDSSCGFGLHGTFANLFRPLDLSTAVWPGYMPVWHSAIVDAAVSCNDLTPAPVTQDQHGTLRPQGANCDIGAIEADYLFVDGFE